MKNKRAIPDSKKKLQRISYMKTMESLAPIKPQDTALPLGLEKGNGKTGSCGKAFDRILVWNLPPVITCPGMSEWCKSNCYNADDRCDIFPIDRWCENLWWVINDKSSLKNRILSQLSECETISIAVRIHSSGDFYSKEYINFWIDIIQNNPNILFWAYTRSWAVQELTEDILKLGSLDNISLILSWDKTMQKPLEGFPKSIVFDSNEEIIYALTKEGGTVCPEQYNLISGCADCGLCINKSKKDIYFILH